MKNVLLEASGTLVSSYMIKAVQEAGHRAFASDIDVCAATYLADDFIIMPKSRDPELWEKTDRLIEQHRIDMVIPTLDETILGWAERKDHYKAKGVDVIVSTAETIALFQDKWKTYKAFKSAGIPTPESSLEHIYPFLKPRLGRGGKGTEVNQALGTAAMDGMIAQEMLRGREYTIDVFCDHLHQPVYIVPRLRLLVKDGKSTGGITVESQEIIDWVKRICAAFSFVGPINIQCFESESGDIHFTEINPRVGGGSALGFAATENWDRLIIENLLKETPIQPVPVKFGLKMFRYYSEVFV